MKRLPILVLIVATIMFSCTPSKKQRQPQPLPQNVELIGRHNALLRIQKEAKYLILPIQESADEQIVKVITNNNEIDNFVVRLSVDSIDYYVPYELPDCNSDLIFDIKFNRHTCPASAICWNNISQSDNFDTTNRELLWRPEYHHAPLYGWMNDPNGMYYDEQTGLWHLYYQYNPYCSMWQNMHWAHSTSADLLHWEHQPLAIRPNALGTIFSGSCVIDKDNTAGFGEGATIAFYTSAAQTQTQSMAYSTDGGITFTNYQNNPVLTDSIPDFRDPKLFWNEQANCWTMTLACGQEMRFYSSINLKNWTLVSRFGKGYGCHEGVWECPDFFRLPVEGRDGESKWVLLCNINPGGPMGGSATQYFVGDFDGTTFTPTENINLEVKTNPSATKWLDYGKDHYATVTFHNAPQDRVVAVAWVSNWQYANQLPTTQYRSQNSLARDLTLYIDDEGEYRVAVRPSQESLKIKGEETNQLTATAVIEIDVPRANKNATIVLSNNKGEKLQMTYNFSKNTFSMDRRHSGLVGFSKDFPAKTTTPLFVEQDTYHLTLYIDHCVVEAFAEDGHWAMTNLVFPTEPYNNISTTGCQAKIFNVQL